MAPETHILLEGLIFGEGPRWHEGKLWFSDIGAGRVMTVTPEGKAETIALVPASPSGLGWLPDGRLLVVSMADRRLLRLDPEGLVEAADLSEIATFNCNDMVVAKQGWAYIGHFGSNPEPGQPLTPAHIIMVTPEGEVSAAAGDMMFPNGMVITPDGGTLVVAESFAGRLTAFDIAEDGSLSGRRVWAELGEGVGPDGICLDAEGAIWVASPPGSELLRVLEGGEVTHRYEMPRQPIACMLGGSDRRTLFIMTAKQTPAGPPSGPTGRIETMTVDVPGAGLP